MILPFLPAANIVRPVGFVIAERILYISSSGYCLLIVIGYKKICKKVNSVKCKVCIYLYTSKAKTQIECFNIVLYRLTVNNGVVSDYYVSIYLNLGAHI